MSKKTILEEDNYVNKKAVLKDYRDFVYHINFLTGCEIQYLDWKDHPWVYDEIKSYIKRILVSINDYMKKNPKIEELVYEILNKEIEKDKNKCNNEKNNKKENDKNKDYDEDDENKDDDKDESEYYEKENECCKYYNEED